MITFAQPFPNEKMTKILSDIKESMQYAGIVALACLSALWLLARGKGRK